MEINRGLLYANVALRKYLEMGCCDQSSLDFVFEGFKDGKIEALVVTQLKAQYIGNIKSFCVHQFRKVLETWCFRILSKGSSKDLNFKFLHKIAKALAIDLAGKTGCGFDNDNEEYEQFVEETSEEKKEFTFEGYLKDSLQSWDLNPTQIHFIQFITSVDRIETYLPTVLIKGRESWTAIPKGKKKCMGWKAWVGQEENLLDVLNFFYQVNQDSYRFHVFPQPNTKNTSLVLNNTMLAHIWCRFLKCYPALSKEYVEKLENLPKELYDTPSPTKWLKHPKALWDTVFPGIQEFLSKNKSLCFGYAGFSDSNQLRLLCYNAKTHNAHLPNSAAVKKHKQAVCRYNSKDFRFYGIQNLSKLVGVWYKGKVPNRPKGLKFLKGFKGIIDLDKYYSEFDGGVDALESLLKRHPLVGIDLGTKTHASMVVLNGSLVSNENETTFQGKWIEKLFAGKAAYSGVDKYLEIIQEQQQQNDGIQRLSETKSRTNNVYEYQQYSQVFQEVSPQMVEQSYSSKNLDLKLAKDGRKQSYYRSIANRILSQCHAIAPEKKGAPILVIGKPTFASSMKGHRAAPPKQLIKFLSRFFTVLLVGEFHTSQYCGQCESKMEPYKKSIRMYTCNCQRSDGGGPLILNKDRSAALAMVRIFTSLFAYGIKPSFYCQSKKDHSNQDSDSQAVDSSKNESIVLGKRKRKDIENKQTRKSRKKTNKPSVNAEQHTA